ncbi:MAG: alpha/beta hydrolase family protein, partial [Planctomycetota bacterium]
PMAVVCHGFGDSKYGAMGSWAGRVIGRCGGVVVYDNRGQGESTAKTADGSLGEAADLAAVVGQVAAMRPGAAAKGVVVVGYSMGANAAIRAVAAMRAAGGDGCGRDGGGVEVVGLMADSPYRRWDGPVRRVFAMNRWPAWPVVGLTGVWLRIGRRWEDTAAVAERLGARLAVLVVGTEADELVGLEDVRAIAAAAERGGADAELLAFEEGRHLAGWDVDRAAYEAEIDRLFDKVAARRGLVQG